MQSADMMQCVTAPDGTTHLHCYHPPLSSFRITNIFILALPAASISLRIEDVLLITMIVIEGLEFVLCLMAALRFSSQVGEFAKNE